MNEYLNSEKQQHSYDFFAAFAKKELNRGVLERDKDQAFAKEEWLACGSEKLHGLCIPKAYGGLGLNAIETANALEALAYGSEDGGLLFSLAAQLLSCTIPLYLHGSEEQKNKYLPLLCSGKLMAANAMTEVQAGSDVFAMQTTAVRAGDNYQLNGEKNYISNLPVSDMALLYAATNPEKGFYGGISAFIIDNLKEKGLSLSLPVSKMGLRSCLMGNMELKNVSVPANRLLGKEGAGAMLFSESMNWERGLMAAIHVGTMKRILEKCIARANSKRVAGEPLGKNQAISHRIAHMHMLLETSALMVHKAARELDEQAASVTLTCSTTKLYVSEALNNVCDMALLIFGANGYITEASVERYKRDAVAASTYSGTNDIQKNIIAKWLGI